MQRVQITLKPFMPPRSRESEIERERERGKQVIEKFFFHKKEKSHSRNTHPVSSNTSRSRKQRGDS